MRRNSDSNDGGGVRTRFHSIKAIECVEFFCYNKLKAILKTFGLSFFFFCSCVSHRLSYKSHRNNQSFVIMLLVKLAKPTPLTALLLSLISLFSFSYKKRSNSECVSFVISWLWMFPFSHTRSRTWIAVFAPLEIKRINYFLSICFCVWISI